jgi:hypothetical protein
MNEQRQRYVHLLKQKEKELANKKVISNPVENQENRRVPTQSLALPAFASVPVKTEPGTEINYKVTPRSKAAEMEIINISDSSEDEMDIDSENGEQRPVPLQENLSGTGGDNNNIRPEETMDDGYFMDEPAAESYAYEPIVDSDDQQEPKESEVSSFKAPQKEEEPPKSLSPAVGEKVTAMQVIKEPTPTPPLIMEKSRVEPRKDVVEEEQAPKRQQQESVKPAFSLSEAIKASEARPLPRMRSNPKRRNQKNKVVLSESLIQKERETLLEIGYFSQFSEPQEYSFSATGTATAAKSIDPPSSSSLTLEADAPPVASHSTSLKKTEQLVETAAKTSPLIHQTPEIEFEEEFVSDPILEKPLPISEPAPVIPQEKPLPIALPVEETHNNHNDEYYDYHPEDQAFEYIDDSANVEEEDNHDNGNKSKDQPPSVGVTPTTTKEPKGNVLQLVAELDSFLQPSTPQPSSSSSAHYKSQNNSNNFNSSFQPPGGFNRQSSTDSQRSQQSSSGGKYYVDRDKSKSNDYYFTESHSRDGYDDREDPFRRKAMMSPLKTSRPSDDSYRRNYNYNHGSGSDKYQVRRELSPEQKRKDDEYLRRTNPLAYYNNVKPDRRGNRNSYSNSREVVETGSTLQEDRAEYERFLQQKQQEKLREQKKDIEKWLGEESEDETVILKAISEERKEKEKEKRKEE